MMMMAVVVLTTYVLISDDEDNGDIEKDGNGCAIPKTEMTEMSRTLYQQYGSTKDADEDRNVTYPVPVVWHYKRCR